MGRARIDRPQKLAKKLLIVRQSLGLSQNGLIAKFGMLDSLTQAEISAFEQGKRLPSLIVLLKYARLYDVHVDDLIDDQIDLSEHT
ncbi:MAG: helix-turn-helix transcriptional regulator [Pyrinomonadaceae bacterium]